MLTCCGMHRVGNKSGRCRKNVIQKIFRKVEFLCSSEFFRILKYIHTAFVQLPGFEYLSSPVIATIDVVSVN